MEENICEKITQLCEAKDMRALALMLNELNPVDIAEAFGGLSMKDIALAYRLLPKEKAAEVFVELDSEKQQTLIELFSDKELKETVNELYVDDTVDIIGEMPATVVAKILKNTSPDMRRMINENEDKDIEKHRKLMEKIKKRMVINTKLEEIYTIAWEVI